ncbi:hypothetical protein CMUS01_12904 [Colletotrichum musicola]|uniref:Uncharacterized protein n=1 Tax=Colletotrichum musicola TaxID=2175873 RepID=A0A8H6MYS1_9PEZI|nr:hypothetical protein CMUS01_12904 [Colletotrichum musicola]
MAHHITEEQPHLQAHHTPVRKQVQTPVTHPAGPRNLPQWTPPATDPRPKLPVLEPPYRGPDVHELEVKAISKFLPRTTQPPVRITERGPDLWPLWSH